MSQLSNATKHSKANNIKVTIELNDTEVSVAVIDDGVGIPSSELESIFAPFKQSSNTHHSLKGSGLGLTICQEIVTAHGGRIWAENNATAGAAVIFTLPKQESIE